MTMSDTMQRIQPFDTGSQFADWTGCNCERCTKGAHRLGPDELPTCEIELALGEAYLWDGKISADIAQRMGYTEHAGRYVWPCGEVEWTEEWKAEFIRERLKQPMTSTATQEPLWSDEAIVNTIEADAYYDGNHRGEGIWVLTSENSVEIARQIRDDYEQRLAAVVAERDALRQRVAELEACADPEALVIAYGKGYLDAQDKARKGGNR